MKKYLLMMLLIVLTFTGCSFSQPDTPKYSINKMDKVGYIIQMNNKIEHLHFGTTAFNNFNKNYDYNWDLKSDVKALLEKKVNAKLVNLNSLNNSIKNYQDIIIAKDSKWTVNNASLYNKLTKDLGLKALIVLSEEPTNISMYPYVYHVEGNGLISHHMFGIKRYFSVLSMKYDLFLLNPVGKVKFERRNYFEIVYDPMVSSFEKKSGFKKPVNIENITQEELLPIQKMNKKLFEIMVNQISEQIK